MPSPRAPATASLFRTAYLDHARLTAQLRAWADAHPEFVSLQSIGTSGDGRELWVLTIGREPSEPRPAIWVDANMHATELCGSSVAMAIAEDFIELHRAPGGPAPHGLPARVAAHLRELHVHVMPRISPDGAEVVLKGEMLVRSIPRLASPSAKPRWIPKDINDDGRVLTIRIADATGEFVESREVPGLMLPRRLTDEGPFFKIYPEGVIVNFDGRTIPSPSGFNNVGLDLNRNFPARWVPEPEQPGAGLFSLSEPESRAVVEFAAGRPTIFAWFNFHTFGGVFIRPPGDAPDTTVDPRDLAAFAEVAAWAADHTSFPTVGGYEQFTYVPGKPLHGDLLDHVYRERGCLAFAIELWDLFQQAGIRRRDKPGERFVDVYTTLTRDELVALGRWDLEHNGGRSLQPWRPFEHAQLGAVELGGIDPRFGLWNPPPERLPAICRDHAAVFMRAAAMAPRVVIRELTVEPRGPGRYAVELTVENHGYLGTYGIASARARPWNEPLRAELVLDGCELDEPGDGRRELGHLDGWGRGRFGENAAPFYQRSRGTTGRAHARWHVRGAGLVQVRVIGPRTGAVSRTVELSRETC